ncbi:MAG: family 1 glycosylhydrolase [Candidatus Dojkabacteria bacterium]
MDRTPVPDLLKQGDGTATSTFQKYPEGAMELDIWGMHVRTGVNTRLRNIWINRDEYERDDFVSGIREVFQQRLEIRKDSFNEHGINDRSHRLNIMELDVDLLEILLNVVDEEEHRDEENAHDFLTEVVGFVSQGSQDTMRTVLILNQFAGLNGEQGTDIDSRYQKIRDRLERFLQHETPMELEGGDLEIMPMPDRAGVDINYWYEEIDRIKAQGGSAFRLSAEWSRLMLPPGEGGGLNQENFEFFQEILRYAKSNGVDTVVCFQHFTFPSWIEGDWSNPDAPALFRDYVSEVYGALGEDARPGYVLTINEPSSTFPAGYLAGDWPPHRGFITEERRAVLEAEYRRVLAIGGIDIDPGELRRNLLEPKKWIVPRLYDLARRVWTDVINGYLPAMRHSVKGHILARDALKKIDLDVQVGYSHNTPIFAPKKTPSKREYYRSYVDSLFMNWGNNMWERMFMKESVKDGRFHADFIGMQYYNMYVGAESLGANLAMGKIDVGEGLDTYINNWVRFPEGIIVQTVRLADLIAETATKIKKRHPNAEIVEPDIYITETGLPSLADPTPEWKILLEAAQVARNLVHLRMLGTLLWTGMQDDFEWVMRWAIGFGRYDVLGQEKKQSKKQPKPLDLANPMIKAMLLKYRSTLIANGEDVTAVDTYLEQHFKLTETEMNRKRGWMGVVGNILRGAFRIE